jgi:hypothetical protein
MGGEEDSGHRTPHFSEIGKTSSRHLWYNTVMTVYKELYPWKLLKEYTLNALITKENM